MRPEDFRRPFSWDKRHVLVHDRVWYVPEFYDQYQTYQFPGWDHPDLFGNTAPVHVEYCSGNGAWIAAKAEANPNSNWVAIEKKLERVGKIWSKLKNMKLNNLLVLCGEAFTATSHYFPAESISEVYINFPDPWPKTRHAKHRLIQPRFLEELRRILKVGHSTTFVTDDDDYSKWTINTFQKHEGFESCFPAPHYVTGHENYGSSYFEELWREQGKVIRYHKFSKVKK